MEGLKVYSAAAIEPVSLAEAKTHLKLGSTDFSADFSETISIAPGSKAIGSYVGASADVLLATPLALLQVGTVPTGATIVAKVRESNDNVTFVDVYTFTTVTPDNDNQTLQYAYTGPAQYIRIEATVAGDACSFGATIAKDAASSADNDILTNMIKAATRMAENYTRRAFITQTWDYVFDEFPLPRLSGMLGSYGPTKTYMEIPKPPLQAITGVYYTQDAVAEATYDAASYVVDTYGEPGRIALKNNYTWPTNLQAINGGRIRFRAGYGDTAASVPQDIRQAILLTVAFLYENREAKEMPKVAELLLDPYVIVRL